MPFGAVQLNGLQGEQFRAAQRFLLDLSTDAMLKPYRERAGLPAPGNDIGGWYDNFPTNWFGRGFAPGHCLGQWISALARGHAITGDAAVKSKLAEVVNGYVLAVSPKFYADLRYPTYTYEKLVFGLIEAHFLAGNEEALAALTRAQLLRARCNPRRQDEWLVRTDNRVLHLRPFTAIDDESYTTYLTTTD